ncbi:MAG: HAD family hydrolase, partial [Thermodesulfobacteriota bacterium]
LIDSEPLWEKAEIKLINQEGISYSNSYREKIVGLNQRDSVTLLKNTFKLKSSIVAIIEQRINILLEIYEKELNLVPGILNLLEEISNQKLKIGLASGSPMKAIEFVLNRFNIKRYFSSVVSGESTRKGKPAPDIYLKAAKQLDIKPENCIAIEDSINGVLSVKNAGMFCIAVPHPDLDINKYKKADLIFYKISDIDIGKVIKK